MEPTTSKQALTPSSPSRILLIGRDKTIAFRRLPRAAPLYYKIRPHTIELDHDLERAATSGERSARLDEHGLLHFAWRGRSRPGHTLYQGVYSLSVGEELICPPNQEPFVRRYWWPLYEGRLPEDNDLLSVEVLRRIDAAVTDAASEYYTSQSYPGSQIGPALLLSGGVDSSLIAALAHRRAIPVTGFTVAFDETYGLNETEFASRVARSLRIPHHVVHVGNGEVLQLLHKVLAAPQPHPVPAAITHVALSEAIRAAGHSSIWSGLGADECFGGYHKQLVYLAAQLHQIRARSIGLGNLFDIPLWRLLRMREVLFLGVAEFFSLRELMEVACDTGAVRTLAVDDHNFYREAFSVKPNSNPLELMAAHEYQYRISELLLPAFTAGLSARDSFSFKYPFLDPTVYLWASALDPARCYWYEDGAWWAKPLLRAIAKQYLPDEIVMRKRQVFLAPLGHWLLSKSLRIMIMEQIADSNFWELEVLKWSARDRLLTELRHYNVPRQDGEWLEQMWVLLTLCTWVNRHAAV
jgi:asparagine synthetase B (glutamine-hydrolysing)